MRRLDTGFEALQRLLHQITTNKYFLSVVLVITIGLSAEAQSTGDYVSVADGNWSTRATWGRWNGSSYVTPTVAQGYPGEITANPNVIVEHNVTLNVSPARSIGNLDVTDQKTLTTSGNPSLTLTGNFRLIRPIITQPSFCIFNGNLTIGGTLTLEDECDFTFGVGTLAVTGATTIGAAATFTNEGTFTTGNTITVNRAWLVIWFDGFFNNNGTVNLTNTATSALGGDGVWTQGANSTFNYAGNTTTIRVFNASNAGNTVSYNRNGAQTIKQPAGNTYHHLTIANGGTKTSSGGFDIAGDLTISGSAQFNPNNNNISVAGNWSVTTDNADPFVQGTSTVTFDGSTPQSITTALAAGETFYALVINNSSGTSPQIILNDIVSVSSSLTMTDGIVQSSTASPLIMLNSSSTGPGSAASFVSGPVQYNMASLNSTRTLNFPIGKNGLYGGASVRVTHNSTTSFSYTAEVIASSAMALNYTLASGTDRVSNLRYWHIKRGLTASPGVSNNNNLLTGTVATAPRVTLYFVAEDEVTQPSTLTVVKNVNNGSTWVHIGDVGVTVSGSPAGSITTSPPSANFLSFSYFALANLTGGTNPLPIELLSFGATRRGNVVDLKWSTASETNNDYFTIERATDPENFETFLKVDGKGTTKEKNQYSVIDPAPLTGRSYYRLKQTDFDGKYTYSAVRVIDYAGPAYATLSVFPNPLERSSSVTLRIEGLGDAKQVPIQIMNIRGQKVFEKILNVKSPGFVTEEIPKNAFPAAGIYIIKAGETLYLTQKIVIE